MSTIKNIFDSPEFNALMNIENVWDKYFNGLAIYNRKSVQAVSASLNGMMEFGEVISYYKKGRSVSLTIEFCGDAGLWTEVVDVYKVFAYNMDAYIDFNNAFTSK